MQLEATRPQTTAAHIKDSMWALHFEDDFRCCIQQAKEALARGNEHACETWNDEAQILVDEWREVWGNQP